MSESGTFETREDNDTYIEVEEAPSPKRARFENAEIEQTEIVHVSKRRAKLAAVVQRNILQRDQVLQYVCMLGVALCSSLRALARLLGQVLCEEMFSNLADWFIDQLQAAAFLIYSQ